MIHSKCKYIDVCSDGYCPLYDDYYKDLPEKLEDEMSICVRHRFTNNDSHVIGFKEHVTRTVIGLSCRSIGCKGTSIDFHVTKDGLKGIWQDANCPYEYEAFDDEDGITPAVFVYYTWDGEHFPYEASDGHNVSKISWQTLVDLVDEAKKNGWV